mmetsp:Transcript_83135/g.252052  ORF Transcript_83135/g.252052 Transcript_83135/m.252052 type:complete len:103 (-) Transcript_83135:66-374(-)
MCSPFAFSPHLCARGAKGAWDRIHPMQRFFQQVPSHAVQGGAAFLASGIVGGALGWCPGCALVLGGCTTDPLLLPKAPFARIQGAFCRSAGEESLLPADSTF